MPINWRRIFRATREGDVEELPNGVPIDVRTEPLRRGRDIVSLAEFDAALIERTRTSSSELPTARELVERRLADAERRGTPILLSSGAVGDLLKTTVPLMSAGTRVPWLYDPSAAFTSTGKPDWLADTGLISKAETYRALWAGLSTMESAPTPEPTATSAPVTFTPRRQGRDVTLD